MPAQRFRHTILLLALAALSGSAVAAGSQAGDNGRMPLGADNEGPRQAIPNATTNDGTVYTYEGPGYYYTEPYGTRHYVPYSPYYAPPTTYYAPPTTYYTPPATYYAPPTTTYYVPAPSTTYYATPYYGPTYWGYWGPISSEHRDFRDALALCDARPLTERPACRDEVYEGRY